MEVIPALQTSDEVVQRAKAFGVACKKGEWAKFGTPRWSLEAEVVLSKDSPGFIANAILMPMINEAILVLEKVISVFLACSRPR